MDLCRGAGKDTDPKKPPDPQKINKKLNASFN
jgi:hypothetical protein